MLTTDIKTALLAVFSYFGFASVLYSEHMYTATSQDLFFFILAIVTGGVGVFLCWSLYEIARMLHQGNLLVTETRDKIDRVEAAVINVKDKVQASAGYLGTFAEGGKIILSHLKKQQRMRDRDREDYEDEPRPRRKSR